MEVALLKTFKAAASHDLKLCCLEMFEAGCKDQGEQGSPLTHGPLSCQQLGNA